MTFATGRANHWVKQHVVNHHGLRLLIVTAVYVFVNVAQFLVKFAIYEFVIFRHDGIRSRMERGSGSSEIDGRAESEAGAEPEGGSESEGDSEPADATWSEAASASPSAPGRT